MHACDAYAVSQLIRAAPVLRRFLRNEEVERNFGGNGILIKKNENSITKSGLFLQ
jgi:hypothetical protein